MSELDHNLLIISDLHLSEGFRPREGSLSPNEDFLSDGGFADFLRFHNECREQLGRPWRLIIAGDLFDFMQVTHHSAEDASVLAQEIDRLKERKPVLTSIVDNPGRRRAQTVEWLDEAINQMKAESANTHQAVIDHAEELKALAPQVEDALVWDLERLVLETWILALKPKAKLSPSECKYGLGTSWPETVWKLDRIAEGHPVFFRALAWFLDQGNALVLMKGNHDVELYWPQAPARMRDLLADAHAHLRLAAQWWTAQPPNLTMEAHAFRKAVQTHFSFRPWIYFEPGVLYLEHGNQYEVADAFQDFLAPELITNDRLIQLPPGSLFARYFLNKVEQSFPFVDNLRPVTRFIAWAFKNRFLSTVGLLVKYQAGLWRSAKELIRRGMKDFRQGEKRKKFQEQRREVSQEEFRRLVALDFTHATTLHATARGPLKEKHLEKIRELAKKERNHLTSKVLHYAFIGLPIFVLALIAGGLLCIFVVPVFWDRIFPENYIVRLIITSALVFAIRYPVASLILNRAKISDYLGTPAKEIWRILKKPFGSDEAPRVRYVVFGHTHEPKMQRLGDEKDAPWYVNIGSWLYVASEIESWERLYGDFVFLQIISDQEADIPRLFRWNEATGRPERLRHR